MEIKNIFIIFPFIILPMVFVFFGWLLYKKGQLAEIEKNLQPIFTTSCSGIIGLIRYNGPFIRLNIYESMIVISYYKKIILKSAEIIQVSVSKKLLTDTIKIEHKHPDYASNIQLFLPKSSKGYQLLIEKFPQGINS